MKLEFGKLSSLIVAFVFAATATTTMARTFRSADVHAKDYPTNLAVKYMGDEAFQGHRRQGHRQGLR